MELGAKLRQARLEAGLSQRQLCGEEITRNMLSLIENGSAKPSMDTLQYLAKRLDKPVSYFLEEQVVISPNQQVMEQARAAYAARRQEEVLRLLEQYHRPDSMFDWERGLLTALSAMEAAEVAVSQERMPYAAALLELAGKVGAETAYYPPELERRRLLLLAQTQSGKKGEIVGRLPGDDRELLLRAGAALESGEPVRAAQYLDAAEDHTNAQWQLLRGRAYLGQGQFAEASACFKLAEERYPKPCAAFLEECCREQEDFKGAYYYACKLRKLEE